MFYTTHSSITLLMSLEKKIGRKSLVKKIMKMLGLSFKDAQALTRGMRK